MKGLSHGSLSEEVWSPCCPDAAHEEALLPSKEPSGDPPILLPCFANGEKTKHVFVKCMESLGKESLTLEK